MATPDSVEMDADERDAFLGNGGTGVVAFATSADEAPHSVPVSFGYDASEATFYFRLAVWPDSEKTGHLDQPVTFVTYGQEDGDWKSVVASGRLEESTEDGIATQTLRGLDRVDIPLVDVFGRPPKEVPFEFYRLVPDSLTGRKEDRTSVE